MPVYSLECAANGKQKTVVMSWDELKQYLADNPAWRQIITSAPSYCQSHRVNSNKKMTSTFKERMRDVQRSHPKGHFPDV